MAMLVNPTIPSRGVTITREFVPVRFPKLRGIKLPRTSTRLGWEGLLNALSLPRECNGSTVAKAVLAHPDRLEILASVRWQGNSCGRCWVLQSIVIDAILGL